MIIKAIKTALKKMDKKYCKLSQIDYSRTELNKNEQHHLAKEKYLERPFAYEFYHQLRKLIDDGEVNFGRPIIQAEVDKRYQHLPCFKKGKIPDFILHVPNTRNVPNVRNNLAVIEFKMATNLDELKADFKKLVSFKKNQDLRYKHAIEVIIGNQHSLESARKRIDGLNNSRGKVITIIEFNTDSWRANDREIKYFDVCNIA
ncbi:MAG: hypothetical protein ABII90_09865 [Bacteroidota bacterium]